jgi:phage terminase small subunit
VQNNSEAKRQGAPDGNQNATSTGLYVKARNGVRLRDRKVQRLVRKLETIMPWLEPSDLPTARAWCELEVLSAYVYAELRDHGVINAEGDARRLLDDYRKLRATQIVLSRELGMTPASRTAIRAGNRETPLDLVAQMASTEPDTVEPESHE